MPIRVLLPILMLLLALPAAADLFRWVDESGYVHYGDRPHGRATAPVAAPQPAEVAVDVVGAARLSREERLLEHQAGKRQAKKAGEKLAAQVRQWRHRRCRIADGELAAYRSTDALYELDDAGRRKRVSSARRKERIEYWKTVAEKWCD